MVKGRWGYSRTRNWKDREKSALHGGISQATASLRDEYGNLFLSELGDRRISHASLWGRNNTHLVVNTSFLQYLALTIQKRINANDFNLSPLYVCILPNILSLDQKCSFYKSPLLESGPGNLTRKKEK